MAEVVELRADQDVEEDETGINRLRGDDRCYWD